MIQALKTSDLVSQCGPRKQQMRKCIVSGEVKPVEDLIRFALGPDGAVIADLKRRLPGRGVWVTAQKFMVRQAIEQNAFQRAFKSRVQVDLDLPEQIEAAQEKAALQSLAFANKAGLVTAGFAKVEKALKAAIEKGRNYSALIHASEASADICQKLQAMARRDGGLDELNENKLKIIRIFNVEQLSATLGRENVNHVIIASGGASEAMINKVAALESYNARQGPR